MLTSQQPFLVLHIREKYHLAGRELFDNAHAWDALTEVLANISHDPSSNATCLIIGGLDECTTDLPKLLEFVVKQLSASAHAKCIVFSRNWPSIEEQLKQAEDKIRLSLELNAESVLAAVNVIVQQEVSQLAEQKKYGAPTCKVVLAHLTNNANVTFLWAALARQDLYVTAKRNIRMKLKSFPPELDALYEQMVQQIGKSDDADLCKQMRASVALVYRPITLQELVAVIDQLEDINNNGSELREMIDFCGSFLILRDDVVHFVH